MCKFHRRLMRFPYETPVRQSDQHSFVEFHDRCLWLRRESVHDPQPDAHPPYFSAHQDDKDNYDGPSADGRYAVTDRRRANLVSIIAANVIPPLREKCSERVGVRAGVTL